LNDLFEVMKELREAYKSLVEDPIKTEFKESFSGSLTFTAGVAIAHYKEPLSVVLGDARAAEKAAKEAFKDDDKNAFALSVLKHSGEARRCLFKWQTGSDYLTDIFSRIVEKLKDKQNGFSNTFIKNIDREFRPLMDAKNEYNSGKLPITKELERLIARSSKTGDKNTDISVLQACVKQIYNCNCCHNQSLENFLSSLHICDFIHRETSNE